MTKHFCDLCGNPALEYMPEKRVEFPGMKWRGTKTSPGSIANVDGDWTPYIVGRIVFDAYEMPRHTSTCNPDLCAGCVEKLLRTLADHVITQAETAVQ